MIPATSRVNILFSLQNRGFWPVLGKRRAEITNFEKSLENIITWKQLNENPIGRVVIRIYCPWGCIYEHNQQKFTISDFVHTYNNCMHTLTL